MAKFNFKEKFSGKAVLEVVQPIALGTFGVIGAQKFLDFKTMFPNMDPNKFFIKNEGLIKVGGVALTLIMWNNIPPMLKWILIGIAIQGGIKATRQLTMNKTTGKSFVEQIGQGTFDEQMNKLADEIKQKANERSQTSVGQQESQTSVGEVYGMGWNMSDMGYRHMMEQAA